MFYFLSLKQKSLYFFFLKGKEMGRKKENKNVSIKWKGSREEPTGRIWGGIVRESLQQTSERGGAQLHHFTASTTAVSILLGGRVATRDNNTTSSSGILRSLSCSAPSSSFLCSCIDTHRHPSDGTTPAFENRSKCFVPVSLFLNQRFPLPHPCSQTLGVLRVWESLAFFFFTSTSVC